MIEIIQAIAVLCQINGPSSAYRIEQNQAACQKKLAACSLKQIDDKSHYNSAYKILLNCVGTQ